MLLYSPDKNPVYHPKHNKNQEKNRKRKEQERNKPLPEQPSKCSDGATMDHTPFGQGAVDYPTLMRRSLSLLSQISAKRWASRSAQLALAVAFDTLEPWTACTGSWRFRSKDA
ncbi:uncharacterized protein LAJ45_07611 [Morchella importuna]|uniref:uncharacterized protein n=1 Tax=Morchella importuna TaxID=1174673 RepID=UPI001E8E3B26|nr:uncharacterized protein LAJ45_07611 [Morchella importuna]KAH8148508.1 hypothetical protein LAJ45_07611 [Morchella importuna]